MDLRHVAIRLFLEEDYNFLWLLENPTIEGLHVCFFKWSPMFSLEAESPVIPIWVTLEKLPIFLFDKEALFEIAKLLGKPIKVDGYTTNKSKLSQGSIFVELDVSKNLPKHLWLNIMGKGTALKVNYPKIPYYCNNYLKLGHTASASHCLATEKDDFFVEHPPPPLAQKYFARGPVTIFNTTMGRNNSDFLGVVAEVLLEVAPEDILREEGAYLWIRIEEVEKGEDIGLLMFLESPLCKMFQLSMNIFLVF